MTNIVELIKSLPDMLMLTPADDVQISGAQKKLGIEFADEYKEYLKAFGAILADGIELSGIAKSKHRNVVDLTEKEWGLNDKVPHTMYVIENTSVDGIIIWQDGEGKVYQTSPGSAPTKIAVSLYDFIKNRTNV